ncbi:MAG TPA: translation initiation factor IF-2 [Caulobacteraceae bacterium]|nr:translation initiation factor IF-2 [Caulobacteraceae bacterium]
MTDENENRPTRAPLTLKPRTGASVSTGTVKQSFSHGRTKTVVVETKRPRMGGPPTNLAAPSPAEKRPPAFDVRGPAPVRPAPGGQSADAHALSEDERQRRQKVAAEFAARQAADRAAAEARAREAAAQRAREEAAARAVVQAEAVASAPAAEASQPAVAAPQPVAEAPAQAPAAPSPRIEAPPPRAEAPVVRAETPRPASAPTQTRTYDPNTARRDDRERTTTYRPDRPPPREGGYSRDGAPPREGGYNRDSRGLRPEGGGYQGRSPRPEGGGYQGRGPREGGGYNRDSAGAPRGDRPPGRPGETVRYSALNPRPPAREGGRPGGPRPPGAGRPAPPPSGPEIQRATRQTPRPGSLNLDRRPDFDEESADARRGKTAATAKAVSRTKGEPKRREGRLTIQALAGDDEDAVERMRSLASVRRAREREREKRKGGQAEAAKTSREVVIPDVITVQELAGRMAVRGVEIIKFLMRQGLMLKINDVIDSDTAELVAADFGMTVRRVSESDVEVGFIGEEDVDDHLLPRPPVVTVMGHVDHGKTSLLDALRSTDVAGGEHGGITQHIGAYQVRLKDGQRVTFLDTPGHAAFSAMRARGANVTDIVVLVVAADDGVMPQTVEAIQHARAAGAPMIVAINKIDKPDANPQRVINELLQHEVVVESLGGDTQVVEVSATQKTGLDELIEAILVQAEVMDLKANPDRSADGVVIESKVDRGRGAVATVLVKRGTLHRGDIVVAGASWGRVRALLNERDEQVSEAEPSTPVEILGLDGAADPGEAFAVVEDEARARELTEYRIRVKRERAGTPVSSTTLADMMARLADKKVSELPLLVKADVQGSAEAIVSSLDKIGTDEVRARIILSGAGQINESDVMLAKGSGAPILGFNVRASRQARDLAEREGVEIRYYAIIYDLLDDIKGVLSGMLAPIQRETFLGNAEVLQVFDISKVGKVAGCRVTEGTVRKGARVRIVREGVVVLELGVLQTLKRFKDEVNEVTAGQECGMAFQGFQDIKQGDFIECFNLEEVKRSL